MAFLSLIARLTLLLCLHGLAHGYYLSNGTMDQVDGQMEQFIRSLQQPHNISESDLFEVGPPPLDLMLDQSLDDQHPPRLAVLTRYSMEYRPVELAANRLDMQEHRRVVEVVPSGRPLEIHFKSPANQLRLVQSAPERGRPTPPPQVERSEEEPRKLFHQVRKPVIQEVHEIIMPFRRVLQEIQPVVEQVHTVISSSGPGPNGAAGGGGNGGTIEEATLSPLLMGVEQQVEPSGRFSA